MKLIFLLILGFLFTSPVNAGDISLEADNESSPDGKGSLHVLNPVLTPNNKSNDKDVLGFLREERNRGEFLLPGQVPEKPEASKKKPATTINSNPINNVTIITSSEPINTGRSALQSPTASSNPADSMPPLDLND